MYRSPRPICRNTRLGAFARTALLCAASSLAIVTGAEALPTGGSVTSGAATVTSGGGGMTVTQASQNAVLNWQGFSIAPGESVRFAQPNSSAVALNRVTGPDPSSILGSLSANGKVFLVNPNGITFGVGAQVNVGGLVASTLNISDADFMAGRYSFSGPGGGTVLNRGSISAHGGDVALLGGQVSNQGLITASLGTVAMAAGSAITLDVAGDGLLNVTIDKGAVGALVQNGGMIQANGGKVVLTAQAAGDLLKTVVNNTGVIEAQTIGSRNGVISLLADMQSGVVNVGGVLDASAPTGGSGGAIETSAATVNVAASSTVTTAAPSGVTGTWTIDPVDFTIGSSAGDNISGATLSAKLVTNSVVISTLPGAANGSTGGTPQVTTRTSTTPGNGDIMVNDAVAWTASSSPTTLTLDAQRDVNVNAAITATKGNLVICCGRDANIDAAITTTNGSVLISAGRDLSFTVGAALTTTDGDITLCAANNVIVANHIALTRGSTIPAQDLGLALGLVIIAGNGGTGPGTAGGTLSFVPSTKHAAITDAPVTIYYNPPSYATQTDYGVNFTLTGTAALAQFMLVFPGATKVADGSTAVTLAGFNTTLASGSPTNVILVADTGATAAFDSPNAGVDLGVTFANYSLDGLDAGLYALPVNCCTTAHRTTGTWITAPPFALACCCWSSARGACVKAIG